MIEVKNLVKKYGGHTAVDDLSFTIESGKIYGLLGPNGAGKSTTMNIMTGYIGATSGDVIIDGHSILDEPDEAKKHIGYLPEIPPLYVDMTVDEYLYFAAKLKKIPAKEVHDNVEKAKEIARVSDVSKRLIKNLSKGYRQRVGLAYAVLGFPEIIILDEPTVGLDPKQIIEIRDVIKSLSKEHTVILSSHILQEVSAVCDHIMIISHGKLVASDTIDNLNKLMQNTNTLELKVKADEASCRKMFDAVEEVESAEYVPDDDGFINIKLNFMHGMDNEVYGNVVEKIFYECASQKMPIYEMKQNKKSLEDLFLQLTGDKNEQQIEEEVRQSIDDAEGNTGVGHSSTTDRSQADSDTAEGKEADK